MTNEEKVEKQNKACVFLKKLGWMMLVLLCLYTMVGPRLGWNTVMFQQGNQEYLNGAIKRSISCVVTSGAIKAVVDMIEGSSVGGKAGAVIAEGNVNVEVGDVAQPALDVVTVLWYASLLSCAYLFLTKLVLALLPFLVTWLGAATLAVLGLSWFYAALGKKYTWMPEGKWLRKARFIVCNVYLILVCFIPLGVQGSACLSRTAHHVLLDEQLQKLENIKGEFEQVKNSLLQKKRRALSVDFWSNSVIPLCYRASKSLVGITAGYVAFVILDGLLFPLVLLVALYLYCKRMLFPTLGIQEKDFLAKMAALMKLEADSQKKREKAEQKSLPA